MSDRPTRSSGRDLSAVRRPGRAPDAVVAAVAPDDDVVDDDSDDLTELTKVDLQERAAAAGLDTSGNKQDLIDRLSAAASDG